MSLRTPLGRVLGLGSAHAGVHHWTVQRATALALVPLAIWFLVSIVRLPLADHAMVLAWIGHGANPVFLVLLVLALSWHSQLGVQVVIEDYVHGRLLKLCALLVSSFAHVLLAAAGVLAVLRIAVRSVA